MNNSFFAGLEAFMEDNPVEATATVSIQPEENIEEVSEADAAGERIDKDDAKFQCAQLSRCIGVYNRGIGVSIKIANDLVASGSTLLTKLYKKPGTNNNSSSAGANTGAAKP